MSNHGIELTNEQVIDFLGLDFCKYYGTFEFYKSDDNKIFIPCGIGMKEGYFLINKTKSYDCLYLKTWANEEDIPHSRAIYDESDNVKDIKFLANECKFYISYSSRLGSVDLTIENDKINGEYQKLTYYLHIVKADDV